MVRRALLSPVLLFNCTTILWMVLALSSALVSIPDTILKSAALGPDNCMDLISLPTLPPDSCKATVSDVPLAISTELGADNVPATRAVPTGASTPKTSMFF